jgi:hypothetical protein
MVMERKMSVSVLRNDDINSLVIIFKGSPIALEEVREITKKLAMITDAIGDRRFFILNFSDTNLDSIYLKFFFESLKAQISKNASGWCTVAEKTSEDYICKTFHYIMKQDKQVFRSIQAAQEWVRLNNPAVS